MENLQEALKRIKGAGLEISPSFDLKIRNEIKRIIINRIYEDSDFANSVLELLGDFLQEKIYEEDQNAYEQVIEKYNIIVKNMLKKAATLIKTQLK